MESLLMKIHFIKCILEHDITAAFVIMNLIVMFQIVIIKAAVLLFYCMTSICYDIIINRAYIKYLKVFISFKMNKYMLLYAL